MTWRLYHRRGKLRVTWGRKATCPDYQDRGAVEVADDALYNHPSRSGFFLVRTSGPMPQRTHLEGYDDYAGQRKYIFGERKVCPDR